MKATHPKIQELRKRSKPVTFGNFLGVEDTRLKLQIDDENPRVVKGYLCVWEVVDSHGTIWTKGAFARSLKERGPGSNASQKILFLWQHDQKDPIGRFLVLKEDNFGLYFEAEVDPVPSGERALIQINSGTINQFSTGFDFIWDRLEWDEDAEAVRVNEVDLYEGSCVSFASIKETYAIRSVEQLDALKDLAKSEVDALLIQVPRKLQLELRQALTEYVTLLETSALTEDAVEATRKTKGGANSKKGLNLSAINKAFN